MQYDDQSLSARTALKRSRILAAATAVFAVRGFHAATMDEIAIRAGVSKPLLYDQFWGKLDMYVSVLQDHIDVLTVGLEQALESSRANGHRVRAAVEAYFDFVDHNAEAFRIVFDASVPGEPSIHLRVGRAHDACIGTVAEAIAVDSGLAPHRARILAAGLVGASQSAARHWLTTGRLISKADAVAAVVTLCWKGLRVVERPVESDDTL
ncbi:TetR/AcrR family transcriptional regulator [Nocardia salmonicida]|uniref:TetR/AcrR family transcriptional regulator n=1 Tax=Nocardia salmonicida TaxID=53431 RepID=UPI0037AE3C63